MIICFEYVVIILFILDILNDEICIDIGLVSTEAKKTGLFSTDVLVKELNTKIVIENQLETTNHDYFRKNNKLCFWIWSRKPNPQRWHDLAIGSSSAYVSLHIIAKNSEVRLLIRFQIKKL